MDGLSFGVFFLYIDDGLLERMIVIGFLVVIFLVVVVCGMILL